MFGLETTTEPAEEPLSLDEAKLHLRIDPDDDAEDSLINALIKAARRLTEKEANRRWIEQTLTLTLPDWPCDQPWPGFETAVALPVEGVTAITAVKYYDLAGTLQALATDQYDTWLSHSPPLVCPAPYGWWPVLRPQKAAAVQVIFTAGASDADGVPEDAVHAMKLALGYWYEHRGDSDDPYKLGLPNGAIRLLRMLSSVGYR